METGIDRVRENMEDVATRDLLSFMHRKQQTCTEELKSFMEGWQARAWEACSNLPPHW